MVAPLALTFLQGDRTTLGSVTFDAVINITETQDVTVTQNPIELGSFVNDHTFAQPLQVEFTGVLSDQSIGSAIDVVSNLISGSGKNAQNKIDVLLRQAFAGDLLTLTTPQKTYVNYAMTSVSAPREARTGTGVELTIKLIEVVTAQLSELSASLDTTQAVDSNNNTTNPVGKQTARGPVNRDSLLLQALSGLGVTP